jgi:hypothetical protein
MYRELSIALFIVVLLSLLDKLGKGIVLREVVALHTALTCLVMPVVGYTVYNRENDLANLFKRYMRVPEEVYFGYALPAVALFILALCWPVKDKGALVDEGDYLQNSLARIRAQLTSRYKYGLYLVGIGVAVSFFSSGLPEALRFFVNLFYFSSFAGILYLYYSPTFKGKWLVFSLFLVFIVTGALNSGMFTIVAYMGIAIFSFFFAGKKYSLLSKLTVFVTALLFVLVLQNVKSAYRTYLWNKDYAGSKASLFTSLFVENLQKGDALIDKKEFYLVHIRVNQGFNVSLVMRRIPAIKPHDNGSALSTSVASSLVPRFLWPDKPEAGGKFNMLYYAGWYLRGWSTNVGPLGEAYGAFGRTGGILYMFVLGMFIRWAYAKVFKIGRYLPLLICWIPVLFYQVTYSAETDTLQILNSLIKTAFFIWLLYKAFPPWFGREAPSVRPKYKAKLQPA